MANSESLHLLEARIGRLIDGILAHKESQMDFLIGLNRLDDLLIDHQQGRPINKNLTKFLIENRAWLDKAILDKSQRKQLGEYLNVLFQVMVKIGDADCLKLAEEIKTWQHTLGNGAIRLTLKGPKEQVSLTDRFHSLLRRETEELTALISKDDHLLTCLDDLLTSAEAKEDKMYHHLAASLTYFLQIEGYKVDPYVKRLRNLRTETSE
jgi:hypothetical protein